MDASARRRGLATIHIEFAGRHADAAWRGEDRRFGEGVAILVGDLAFVYADMLLADAPRAALDVFTELRLEVNVGQYLDLRGAVAADTDVETGAPHRALQVGQVHGRAAAAPRRGDGRTSRRPGGTALALRRSAR